MLEGNDLRMCRLWVRMRSMGSCWLEYPAQCKEWSPSGYLKAFISQMQGREDEHFSGCSFGQLLCTLAHLGFSG